MARYYLGKRVNQVFEPICLDNIGTSIKDVVDFTTSFAGEMELRNYLLQEGLIPFWDDELAYVKERGTKGAYYYTPIPLGNNICTVSQKKFFEPERIKEYCFANWNNLEFYMNMAAYYIRKYKIDQLLEKRIRDISTKWVNFSFFLQNLYGFSGKAPALASKLLLQFQQASDAEKEKLLKELFEELLTNNRCLIRLFEIYSYLLDINYGIAIEKMTVIIGHINSKTALPNVSQQDINFIIYLIDELLAMLIHYYDPKEKGYVFSESGCVVNERGLVDLGLFLAVHHDYEHEYPECKGTLAEDEGPEHFLEEEDFRRLHTSAEREGFNLRKKDRDKK